ncbi:MAG: hypothetical protein LBG79_02830, partial [Spirochaetaceae bacterium]|nr:hypothetical protein [Spirochaetaceae bacterium]
MPTAKTGRKAGGTTTKKPAKKTAKAAAPKTAKKVTLEDVWATIAEIGKAHKELEQAIKETQKAHRETEQAIKETQNAHRETEQAIKETRKAHRETEQAIEETRKVHEESEQLIKETRKIQAETAKTMNELSISQKETQLVMKRLAKNVGGLNQSIGELVEILVAANLWEKFPEYDLQRSYRRLPVYDEKNIIKAEVDILLVNTEWAMAVEVKRQAKAEDVNEHLERMERILKYPPG